MQPQISVIVTSYNTAAYIERAVNSALAQTGVTLEVIIVDDCSSDHSWQIIESMTDPRIKRFRPAQNGGPSTTRNLAIGMASGEWLAVLDSDDELTPGRLERCVGLAQRKNADIVIDNLTVCPETGGPEYAMFESMPTHLTLADFIEGNQAFLGGFTLGYVKPMFRAAFMKEHNLAYAPDIRIGEDYLLLAQALAEGAVCVGEQTQGYRYTVRAGSISQRLKLSDVERIGICDARLTSSYKLDEAALAAQEQRAKKLKEAYAFTQLVDALKAKDLIATLKAISYQPTALIQLWRPIHARLKRLQSSKS